MLIIYGPFTKDEYQEGQTSFVIGLSGRGLL